MTQNKKHFENIVVTSIFSFSPQCFLPFQEQILIFQSHLFLLSANCFKSKVLSCGKEFIQY